jgi:hypothetical protein
VLAISVESAAYDEFRITVSVPYELMHGLFFGVPKAFTLREGDCKG